MNKLCLAVAMFVSIPSLGGGGPSSHHMFDNIMEYRRKWDMDLPKQRDEERAPMRREYSTSDSVKPEVRKDVQLLETVHRLTRLLEKCEAKLNEEQ